MPPHTTIPQKANNPTGLQNPSAWARNYLGLSFASFGQKEDWSNMPVNSQYGFIFTKASHTEEQISRAIAHELGHGAFHLWHTFSTENKYVASQGTTQNLMDYNATSTDLYKYQWDYIHNPEFVLFRGDDEEGESQIGDDYICKIFNDFLKDYPKAKDWWNAVSDASAIYDGIASFDVSKILSLSNGFKCFESSWSLYKETLTIKNLSFEEKYYIDNVESMIQTINSQIQ